MSLCRRILLITLVLSIVYPISGCVRRRLTVNTNPPGATVYLDNTELGKTPISRNFDFYGKRELRIAKDGYETHKEMIAIRAPWYEWPGIDFFSEVLIPGEITDKRYYNVNLRPQTITSPDDLIAQGERLKAIAHSSGMYRVENNTPAPSPQTEPTAPDSESYPVPVVPRPEQRPDTPAATPFSPTTPDSAPLQPPAAAPDGTSVSPFNPVFIAPQ